MSESGECGSDPGLELVEVRVMVVGTWCSGVLGDPSTPSIPVGDFSILIIIKFT